MIEYYTIKLHSYTKLKEKNSIIHVYCYYTLYS